MGDLPALPPQKEPQADGFGAVWKLFALWPYRLGGGGYRGIWSVRVGLTYPDVRSHPANYCG